MGLPSVGEMMSVTRAAESSSSKVFVRSTMPLVTSTISAMNLSRGKFAVLHQAQLVFPLAGHVGLGERVGFDGREKLEQRLRFLRGHELTLVSLHVLLIDETLDRVGAGRGCAETAFFHRLGHVFIVDELAGAFHGGEQRRFRVAWRRLGELGVEFGVGRASLRVVLGGEGREGFESGESSSTVFLP